MTDRCDFCQRSYQAGCDRQGHIQVNDSRCPSHLGQRQVLTLNEAPCELCDGTGWLNTVMKPCPNMIARQMVSHLGKEIMAAPRIRSSPLLDRTAGVNMTTQNVLITGCTWQELMSHLQFVLSYQGLQFFFKLLDDERIKNVFVGNEHFKSLPIGRRHDPSTTNSLAELVEGYNLVIIRLGRLGYKNVAAPGALKEALMIRERQLKPTWLHVQNPDFHWIHSKDWDVEDYVNIHFKKVPLAEQPGQGTLPHTSMVGVVHHEADDINSDDENDEVKPFLTQSPTFEDVEVGDLDMGPLGGGDEPKKRRW